MTIAGASETHKVDGELEPGATFVCPRCGHAASAVHIGIARHLAAEAHSTKLGRKVSVETIRSTDQLQCPECEDGVMVCRSKQGMSAEQVRHIRDVFIESFRKDPRLVSLDAEEVWGKIQRHLDVNELERTFEKIPKKRKPPLYRLHKPGSYAHQWGLSIAHSRISNSISSWSRCFRRQPTERGPF